MKKINEKIFKYMYEVLRLWHKIIKVENLLNVI